MDPILALKIKHSEKNVLHIDSSDIPSSDSNNDDSMHESE